MSFKVSFGRSFLVSFGIVVFSTFSSPFAHAGAKVCGERAKLAGYLKKKYSENQNALGVSAAGKSLMEIYTSENGTWTVLMTTASGVSCIMAAGHSWEERDKLALLPKS